MHKDHNTWLIALVALAAWVALCAGARAADPDAVLRLEMSTRLTLAPAGTAPDVAAPSETVSAPLAPPATGRTWPWILLAALVGAALGWAWPRRAADKPPAGDPISRAKIDGLRVANRALQADLRAVMGAGKDAWQSTLRSLRNDLEAARRSLDTRIDAERALTADLDAVRAQRRHLQNERDAIDATLTDVRGQLVRSETTLAELRNHARETDEKLAALREENANLEEQAEQRSEEHAKLSAKNTELQSKGELLQAAYDDATHGLRLLREQVQPAREEAAQAQTALAQMLDKNLALEARIAQLSQGPDTHDELPAAEAAALRKALAQAREQAPLAQAQNASLSAALGQIKAELATVRDAHAGASEENANLHTMLATAEDRVDAQSTMLSDLTDEVQTLRAQLGEHVHRQAEEHSQVTASAALEDEIRTLRAQLARRGERQAQAESQAASLIAQAAENQSLRTELEERDRALAQALKRQSSEQQAPADVGDDPIHDPQWAARSIEQLTRSRDAALSEMHALRARLDSGNNGRSEVVEQQLAGALSEIKMLKADLRVRADVIKALERDAAQLEQVQEKFDDQSSQVAFLNNELALALDEVARIKKSLRNVMARSGGDDATTAALRGQVEELRARLQTKDQIIATMEIGRQKQDVRVVDAELVQLRADQRASISVIRFLESEIQRLGGKVEASSTG